MRILRSVAFYQYIQTVHEYETERISSEIPEPKQIVFYNGINPMSALADIFPVYTLFLLLLMVIMGGSHSPFIVTPATCQIKQTLCPCKAF